MRSIPIAGALLAALASGAPSASALCSPGIVPAPCTQDATDSEDLYEQLVDDFDAALEAWMEEQAAARKAAEEAGESIPAMRMSPPMGEHVQKFLDAAGTFAGTEKAVPFLKWVATRALRYDLDMAKTAWRTIVKDHLESPALDELGSTLSVLPRIMDEEEADALIERIEAAAKSKALAAWASFHRSQATLESAELDSAAYRDCKATLLEKVVAAGDERLESSVRRTLREREVFSVGMIAPDIEGIDLDGTAFKLSDYKGKILFVDFWGDW